MGRLADFTNLISTVVPNAEVTPDGVIERGYLRAYGHISIVEKAADEGRLIIAGYASPQVVDREKHVITKEALARDLPRFMAEPDYRNANLLHSNVQVGKVIPSYITADGKRYDTKVDDVGLFCVVEVRTDPARPKICDKVADDIRSGKLAAFSISADAPYDSRRHECAGGTCFWVIDGVELYEVTICETPVNQDAKFTLLTKSLDTSEWAPYTWCQDGSCTVVSKAGDGSVTPAQPAQAAKPIVARFDSDLHNADWTKGKGGDADLFFRHRQEQAGKIRLRDNPEKLDNAKKYIKHPLQAPPGVQVQQGPHGGYYYESKGVKGGGEEEPEEKVGSEEEIGVDETAESYDLWQFLKLVQTKHPSEDLDYDLQKYGSGKLSLKELVAEHPEIAKEMPKYGYKKLSQNGDSFTLLNSSKPDAGKGAASQPQGKVGDVNDNAVWHIMNEVAENNPGVMNLMHGDQWQPLLEHPVLAQALVAAGYGALKTDQGVVKLPEPKAKAEKPVGGDTSHPQVGDKFNFAGYGFEITEVSDNGNIAVTNTLNGIPSVLGPDAWKKHADKFTEYKSGRNEAGSSLNTQSLNEISSKELPTIQYHAIASVLDGEMDPQELSKYDGVCKFLNGKNIKFLTLNDGHKVPVPCGGSDDEEGSVNGAAPKGSGNTDLDAEAGKPVKPAKYEDIDALVGLLDDGDPAKGALDSWMKDYIPTQDLLQSPQVNKVLADAGFDSIKDSSGRVYPVKRPEKQEPAREIKPNKPIRFDSERIKGSAPLESADDVDAVDDRLRKAGNLQYDYHDSGEAITQKIKAMQNIGAGMQERLMEQGMTEGDVNAVLSKFKLESDGSSPANAFERAAAGLTHSWAVSSSDHRVASVIMQRAVADAFGLPSIEEAGLTVADGTKAETERLYADPHAHALIHAYVAATYEQTQYELEQAGVEELSLVRGMTWEEGEVPDWLNELPESEKRQPTVGATFSSGYGTETITGVEPSDTLEELERSGESTINYAGQEHQVTQGTVPGAFETADGTKYEYSKYGPDDYVVYTEDGNSKNLTGSEFQQQLGYVTQHTEPRKYYEIGGNNIPAKTFMDYLNNGTVKPTQQYKIQSSDGSKYTLNQKGIDKHFGKNDKQRFAGHTGAVLNPISSFSTDHGTARGFGNSRAINAMAAVKVPRERIFGKWGSGPGCLNEHEVVVLGGQMKTALYVGNRNLPHELQETLNATNQGVQVNKMLDWRDMGSQMNRADATGFSTKRELGAFDNARPSRTDVARGERLNSMPQAPLDLTEDQHGETPNSDDPNLPDDFDFDEVFSPDNPNIAPSGNYGTSGMVKAGYNQPNTLDDETQYLNFDEPAPYMPEGDEDRDEPAVAAEPYVSLTEEGAKWKISKDNEASGFPPDAASGQVILGTDHPTPPKLQGKPKQPKLQQPVTGTPSIMRALDAALTDVTKLNLSVSQRESVHVLRKALATGALPFTWDPSPRILGPTGAWTLKGSSQPASAFFTALRKAAVQQGDGDLVIRLGMARTWLQETAPLNRMAARRVAASLLVRAENAGIYGSVLNKAIGLPKTPSEAMDPKRELEGIASVVGKITRDPEARRMVEPRLLATLDTIYDEARRATEGLELGLALAASGPEHSIIKEARAGSTMNDVRKTDRLLEAVNKADLPGQQTQDEAEAAPPKPDDDHHDSAMIAWFPTSGTAHQFAHEGGEAADDLHVTVVYLGKVKDYTPEHFAKLRLILKKLCLVQPPIEGEITGITHFASSPSSDGRTPVVASIAADDLHAFRRKLTQALDAAGIPYSKTFKHYIPHMTLKYDLPGMDDMQERGIPEIESTPIEIDRLHLVVGGKREEFTLDEGQTQIDGKDPQQYARKVLKSGDEDALTYGGLFNRMWRRGFPDPNYTLVLQKSDGMILPFDE